MNKNMKIGQNQSIRQNFRKQIRRKQIQHIFAIKRKLIAGSIDEQLESANINNPTLNQLFSQVKTLKNLDSSLTVLGNSLFQYQSLKKYQQKCGQKAMKSLCIQITNTIFNVILPHLHTQQQQDKQNRIKCLTIISNIIADGYAPHTQLIPIISEGINKIYPNMGQTNVPQLIQIGWVITNIICHKLDLSEQSELQKPIEQVLKIAQQVMFTADLQIVGVLFKSMRNFYCYIDQYFSLSKQEKVQIEHFKIHRLIFLENIVNYNLNLMYGSGVLLPAIDFIESNLLYLDSCHEKIRQQICFKCFKILECASSDKIMVATLRLIKLMSVKKNIIVLIIKDHFQTIQKCLLYFGVNIKRQTLRLIVYLCADQELTTFMVQNKDLESCICQLIRNIKDSDTQAQLMILTKIIINQTHGKCGYKIWKVVDQYLSHKVGLVGQLANDVLNSFETKTKNA